MALEQDILDELQIQSTILKGMAGSRASSAGSSSGIAFGTSNPVEKAAKDLAGSMGKVAGAATDSVLALTGFNNEVKDGASAVKYFAGLLGAGALGGVIANTIDQYREFLNVGQSFNGSMIQMAEVAARSHQSMEQLYKGFRAAGIAAAQLGVERFSELSSAVRAGAREFGSFGMTIEDMNEFMGEQLEMRRLTGLLDSMDRGRMSKDFNDLHKQTMALSAATGKSRDEILKATMGAQKQSAAYRGWAATLTGPGAQDAVKRAELAMNTFAAMPEGLSDLLTSGFGDVLGGLGAEFSPTLQAFQKFAPNVNQAMNNLRDVVNNGGDTQAASAEVLKAIKDLGPDQIKQFRVLAIRGNTEAKQILESYNALQGINVENLMAQQEQAGRFKAVEETLLNFGQNLSMVSGEIRGAFLVMLKPAIEALTGPNGQGGPMSTLADAIKGLSGPGGFFDRLGKGLATVITQIKEQLGPGIENTGEIIKRFSNKMLDGLATVGKFIGFLDENGNVQLDVFLTGLADAGKFMVDILYKLGGAIAKTINFFNEDMVSDEEVASINASLRKREYGDAAALLGTSDRIASLYKSGSETAYSKDISMFAPGDKNSINTSIESLVKGILADGEISKDESKLMRELTEKNVELLKALTVETAKQTGIQGMSLEQMDKSLKEQKAQTKTARTGM